MTTCQSSELEVDDAPLVAADQLRVEFVRSRDVFGRQRDVLVAVDGFSLAIHRNSTVAVVGESGSGKTTASRALLGLVPTVAGDVRFRGLLREDFEQRFGSLSRFAQMVYQDPAGSLNPRHRVGSAIGEALLVHGITDRANAHERVAQLFADVGLPASAATRYPHELSGGQCQRVAIARALAVEPSLMICDEVVSALDVSVQAQILGLLKKLQAEHHMAYLFIAHDLSVVRQIADRVLVMRDGQIVEEGGVRSVFENPQHPYTKQLLAAVPSALRRRAS